MTPGVGSASNGNEYQEYFVFYWGLMGPVRKADNHTAILCRCHEIFESRTLWATPGLYTFLPLCLLFMVMYIGTSIVYVFNLTFKYLCCLLIYLAKKSDWVQQTALLYWKQRSLLYICVFVCVPKEQWRRLGQIDAC